MPLSREEASNIGKEAADKVIKSAQACRCGLAVWDTRTNIASIEAVILHQQADWLQPISRLQQDTLTIVERDCGVDMTKAKEVSARLENDIKKRDWQEARADLVFLRGAIQGRLVEGAEEGSNPGDQSGGVYRQEGLQQFVQENRLMGWYLPFRSKRESMFPTETESESLEQFIRERKFWGEFLVWYSKWESLHPEAPGSYSNPGGQHVTIEDPGKTTFKPGEVISKETFDKENERVRKLGEKPATGVTSNKLATAKEPWQMTLQEYAYGEARRLGEAKPRIDWVKAGYGQHYRDHKASVKYALSKGKPVPPEVLKDYPDLAKAKPTRDKVRVEVWEERDRLHIGIQDKDTGDYYVSWWDDEARQMFEDGFFKRGRELEESVLGYAEDMGILAK